MSKIATPDEVLRFWVEEAGEAAWYVSDTSLDEDIRQRFMATWEAARRGELRSWATKPQTILSYLVVLDQFPRNMFRGEGKAFATDGMALSAAKAAIAKGWDLRTNAPERQFFYLPLMHSELLSDQSRCLRLMLRRMPDFGASSGLLHAQVHRAVIRDFGRFPYRNAALGRKSTALEEQYLQDGGYARTLRELQAS